MSHFLCTICGHFLPHGIVPKAAIPDHQLNMLIVCNSVGSKVSFHSSIFAD